MIKAVRGCEIDDFNICSKWTGRLKGPADFDGFNLGIKISVSAYVTGDGKKEPTFLPFRKD